MERFFKKGNGTIIEANDNHDLKSLKDRFTECDANGKEIKKVAKKAKKKVEDK
tara:strand:- start:165 stop:323 length:159 start_codon:yes stop_codon:yes gene_type:complete